MGSIIFKCFFYPICYIITFPNLQINKLLHYYIGTLLHWYITTLTNASASSLYWIYFSIPPVPAGVREEELGFWTNNKLWVLVGLPASFNPSALLLRANHLPLPKGGAWILHQLNWAANSKLAHYNISKSSNQLINKLLHYYIGTFLHYPIFKSSNWQISKLLHCYINPLLHFYIIQSSNLQIDKSSNWHIGRWLRI